MDAAEAPGPAPGQPDRERPDVTAIVDEAAKRSGLIWVQAAGDGHRPQPVWHLWQDGAAYVLTGGIEQPVPEGLADRALVTIRSKDKRNRLVTVEATVEQIPADSPQWQAVEAGLLAKRLNLPDGDRAPQRWRRECTLYRLTPTGRVVESPDAPSRESHAQPPPPTPARTRVPRPLHLWGRPARNRGGR